MRTVSIAKSHLKALFELYASIFQNIPLNTNLGDAIFRTIGTKTKEHPLIGILYVVIFVLTRCNAISVGTYFNGILFNFTIACWWDM